MDNCLSSGTYCNIIHIFECTCTCTCVRVQDNNRIIGLFGEVVPLCVAYVMALPPYCWLQIGKAVFDPLLESSETVYLGLADGQSWSSFELSDDGGHQSDPANDMDHFSQLWRSWSSTVEQGKHS